jgi:hypothetical protein
MPNVIAATIYGNASEIEIFWVILAAIGLIFAAYNLREAHKDMKALDREGITNGRRTIAKAARYQDGCRAVVHAVFLAIGLSSAIFLPDMDLDKLPTNILVVTILVRWGLILSAGILVSQSYVSYALRRTIIRDGVMLRSKIEE